MLKTLYTLPPKEKTIVPPRGGWREHTLYLAEVSYFPTNPRHLAYVQIGFLNDIDGGPGGYCYVYSVVSGEAVNFGKPHYIQVLRKLWEEKKEKSSNI